MTDYTALIPFSKNTLDNEVQQTVNARDLHTNLEIGKDYTNWIKAQIKSLHLIENIDFVLFAQKGEYGNKPLQEYFLTIDTAKHVALASRTPKGREIRDYFIACEKKLREGTGVYHNPQTAMLIDTIKRLDAYEAEQARQTQQLIETQQHAIQALQAAQQANARADLALEHSHTMTIEEFILGNKLLRQFPPTQWKRYAAWLRDFCLDNGLPMRKVPVVGKVWTEENAYSLQAFSALLRHETKKPRQLAIVPKEMRGDA